MEKNRRHIDSDERFLDAAAGYAVIVLSLICFMLSLAVITGIVRLIVGAGAGA